jgi:hypothetical protein
MQWGQRSSRVFGQRMSIKGCRTSTGPRGAMSFQFFRHNASGGTRQLRAAFRELGRRRAECRQRKEPRTEGGCECATTGCCRGNGATEGFTPGNSGPISRK